MKKTKSTEDELLDDEITRIQAIEDGPRRVKKWNFRPVTGLTISWMQRNGIIGDANKDAMFRAAAFAFIHSSPIEEVREVVNYKDDFMTAVDNWIEENAPHHEDIMPVADEMNLAFDRYSKSTTAAKGGKGSGLGN
mgnify:CR=1 FL=1